MLARSARARAGDELRIPVAQRERADARRARSEPVPDYTPDLVDDFSKEMELFVGDVFESDGSVLDLLTSDKTFVNERLAIHYGVKNVRRRRSSRSRGKNPIGAGCSARARS